MPLYISDDAVNDLAERLAALTGENKTEAVRSALEKQIEALQKTGPLQERVTPITPARGLRGSLRTAATTRR